MEERKSVFETLNAIDVGEHIEKKNGLSYVSWAWAWRELKKVYPDAYYTVYENEQGWNYFTDGRTAWVKTGVTVEGLELIEYLPVMDYNNKSIPLEKITSFDVNKTIQRSLTKAIGRHGLGLYVYAGEDLPEEPQTKAEEKTEEKVEPPQKADNVSQKVREQAELFNVNLVKLAIYLKKSTNELTDEDVLEAIEVKRQRQLQPKEENKQWLTLMKEHTHTQMKMVMY